MKKDSLRTTPEERFKDTEESRNRHVLKLCNLPRGTTVFDLSDYIESVGGKTYFIPKTRDNYKRVRYAFIVFNSEQNLQKFLLEETLIYIKNNHVSWLRLEIKTCHICQGQEHLAANCPRIQERKRNKRRILKFSNLYHKKRVNTDNVNSIHKKAEAIIQKKKSFAEAVYLAKQAHTTIYQ
jgi:hypothetical protein